MNSSNRSRVLTATGRAPNQIRAVREARDFSLEALATAVGTTNQQISLLETGKRRLTVEWLIRLSTALSCHPWALVSADLPWEPRAQDIHLLSLFQRMSEHQQMTLLRFLDVVVPRVQSRKQARPCV